MTSKPALRERFSVTLDMGTIKQNGMHVGDILLGQHQSTVRLYGGPNRIPFDYSFTGTRYLARARDWIKDMLAQTTVPGIIGSALPELNPDKASLAKR